MALCTNDFINGLLAPFGRPRGPVADALGRCDRAVYYLGCLWDEDTFPQGSYKAFTAAAASEDAMFFVCQRAPENLWVDITEQSRLGNVLKSVYTQFVKRVPGLNLHSLWRFFWGGEFWMHVYLCFCFLEPCLGSSCPGFAMSDLRKMLACVCTFHGSMR